MSPIRELRGSTHNYGVFLGKPYTEMCRGLDYQHADALRDIIVEETRKAFIKKLNKENKDGGTRG